MEVPTIFCGYIPLHSPKTQALHMAKHMVQFQDPGIPIDKIGGTPQLDGLCNGKSHLEWMMNRGTPILGNLQMWKPVQMVGFVHLVM